MNTYNEALSTVIGWVHELRRTNGRVDADHLAAAHAAAFELMTSHPETTDARTWIAALRAELAYAEVVALNARLTPAVDVPAEEPEQGDAEEESLAEWERDLLAGSVTAHPGPETPPWEGWSAPAPVSGEETRTATAERVAADLEGAADLLSHLIAETGAVPEPIADRASANILRALAAGAVAVRTQLATAPRIVDRAPANAELMAELSAVRTELAGVVKARDEALAELEGWRHAGNTQAAELRGWREDVRAFLDATLVGDRRRGEDALKARLDARR